MCVCLSVETVLGRIVRREEEARLDTAGERKEGRREAAKVKHSGKSMREMCKKLIIL